MVWFITIIFISQYLQCFNYNIIFTKKKSKLKTTQSISCLKGTVQSYAIKHTKIKENTEHVNGSKKWFSHM